MTKFSKGIVLLSIALLAVAQGADTSLEKLIAMQRAWGSEMSSKGAALSLKEVSRNTADGHAVIRYRMFTSGLPEDAVYSLLTWQLGGLPQTVLTGITLDEKGIAVCAGKPQTCGDASKPNDPIDLTMSGGLGEPKRVGLISRDKTAQVFASVVPFPNRATDAGCVLEARLVTPNAEAVMLFGSGFEPGGRLNLEITSEGEKQHPAATANQNGTYSSVILPFKKGLAKGRTQVSVRSKECNPVLSFSWGTDSYALQN